MTGGAELAVAALVLSVERIVYVATCRCPAWWRRTCATIPGVRLEPVAAIGGLFICFKAVQLLVFGWWWMRDGHGLRPVSTAVSSVAVGAGLIAVGQVLNLAVFARLGLVGMLYGSQFGYAVPWRWGFPFSWFRHPQYVGTVMSIWGAFMVMRYPAPDWSVLPVLETIYYTVGAHFEREPTASRPGAADRSADQELIDQGRARSRRRKAAAVPPGPDDQP